MRSDASRRYYHEEWNRLEDDDRRFFEYLCLEIFQADLSWDLVMRKREGMREALDGFDFRRIQRYDDERLEELGADPRVVRNRRKLAAIRDNARSFSRIVAEDGSFLAWLRSDPERDLDAWVLRFRSRFAFMGPEVVREFLESAGVLGPDGSWTDAFSNAIENADR